MVQDSPTRRAHPSEEGYILVAVVFMTAILILSLAVALPRVKASIQRDREIETMQRGKQYIRAVQLYYKKFNAYPPNIDALIKTNNIRFLRRKYVDPTTGKEEWKPVLYGQNKTPQAMGFFGQPLAATALGGIGPSGGNGIPGSSSGIGGSTTSAGGGLFNTTTTGGTTDAGTGTAPPAGTGGSSAGGTDANGNPIPGGAGAGGVGAGGAGAGGIPASGATGSTSAFGGPGTSGGSTNGQTFGGGGIIGFSPQSPKQSILVYKKKNHYNEWEFLYSPLADQQMVGGGNTGAIGQPASSTTSPVGAPTTISPIAPTNPTPPQQ